MSNIVCNILDLSKNETSTFLTSTLQLLAVFKFQLLNKNNRLYCQLQTDFNLVLNIRAMKILITPASPQMEKRKKTIEDNLQK